jgi:hypothetical protein
VPDRPSGARDPDSRAGGGQQSVHHHARRALEPAHDGNVGGKRTIARASDEFEAPEYGVRFIRPPTHQTGVWPSLVAEKNRTFARDVGT